LTTGGLACYGEDKVDFGEIDMKYPSKKKSLLKKRLVSFRKLPSIKNSSQNFKQI
jgi:NADPH-dependent 7-cyano-7-deazaguanine reductase QueF